MTRLNLVTWRVVDVRDKSVLDQGHLTEKQAKKIADKLVRKGVPAVPERVAA